MSVFEVLGPIKGFIGWDKYHIDDLIFRLHCKVTPVILLVFCLIVTASQFIGDPIDCIVEDIPQPVMDTYCWIHSTFTLPKTIYEKVEGETAHPGVGVPSYENGEETYHKYYQWVAFTLFFQLVLFRVPRTIWRFLENNRMDTVLPKSFYIEVDDKRMPRFPVPYSLLKEAEIESSLASIHEVIEHQFGKIRYNGYFFKYHICEWLNLLNVTFQMILMDVFLGGMFSTYGSMVWNISNLDPEDRNDPMNLVFPKVAKCTFRRFGPSGTPQVYDGLCILPINIFNEKVYVFLWFWFILLAVVSALGLCYRFLTFFSVQIRAAILRSKSNLLLDPGISSRVAENLNKEDWFFLSLLGSNLEPYIFTRLVEELDKKRNSRHFGNGNIHPKKVEKLA